LGRRFRALKLWFVIRNYGVKGIQKKIREHIDIAAKFEKWILKSEYFEKLTSSKKMVVITANLGGFSLII